MIKLKDAELISMLPTYIKKDVDICAISYAFKMGMEKFLYYARLSSLLGMIDILPETLLDLLALELQSQYYNETLSLEAKKGIIKNSMAWYFKGGTVSAVEELIQVVFGSGELEEWYKYGGKPGTFRIKLNMGAHDVQIDIYDILKKIKRYKKLSAHFDAIVIGYYFYIPIHYDNAIRIRIRFYPQFNLPRLFLDKTWKLDGNKKLNGYDGAEKVDFYPVCMTAQTSVHKVCGIGIQSLYFFGAKAKIRSRQKAAIRILVEQQKKIKEKIIIYTLVKEVIEVGKSKVYNRNILEGTWKLNGSRKLNGGKYQL